jgi:hypothetical protein
MLAYDGLRNESFSCLESAKRTNGYISPTNPLRASAVLEDGEQAKIFQVQTATPWLQECNVMRYCFSALFSGWPTPLPSHPEQQYTHARTLRLF